MQRSDVSLLGSLVMSILIFLNSAGAEPVYLAGDAVNFAVLNDTEVIYCDMDANFFIVDINAPGEARPWDPHWDPTDMGWGSATTLIYLCVSPDGEWVCFAQFLEIPEDATGDTEFVPWPLAVVISPVHGEAAWFAALAMEVGGGPDFDFTMDSMNLYGQPFVPSRTTLEDYLAWFRRDLRRERIEEFTSINLLSGEQTGGDLFLGDGYLACPYSDLIAADDMMVGMIVDMSEEEILFQEDTGDFELLIDKWVLDDAILVHRDGKQYLLYSDGTLIENPGEADIDVYCWMPGGEYLFSDDNGESIKYGNINWETFTSADAVMLTDTTLQLTAWSRVLPMSDGSGIVFDSFEPGGLAYFPVPGN